MSTVEVFYRFGTALAIGFLVGLQREFTYKSEDEGPSFAGVRTFTLIALAGCTAALAASTNDLPALGVGVFLVVGALVVASYVATSRAGDVGATTEVAAVITFLAGLLCYRGRLEVAVAIGVTTTVLLSAKLELRRFVTRLRREDVVATLKFGVVTAIVLPLLPDEGLGPPPFDVVNPHNVWLMVVLISSIGFVGYVLIQFVGPRRGIGLTGLLGGLVSSTAVTLSFSQKSRQRDGLARPFALAIIVAWTMMFARVLVAVLVVNRALLSSLWFPMTVAGLLGLGYAGWLHFSDSSSSQDLPDFANPFEIGPALRFGLLYGLVLWLSRAAQLELGERGVYLSALVAGIADVDAITLSMAELSRTSEALSYPVAARAVVVAAMANTAVKAAIVLVTAGPALKRAIWPGMLLVLAGGLGTAFL